MKNKRIDIISKYFYPVTAGIEVNILETYKVLVKKGWRVTIHTSTDTLADKNTLPRSGTHQGIKIVRYPYKWYGYFPNIDWRTTSIVAIHNFNVSLHTLFIYLKVILLKSFGNSNFRLILTPHGGFNPEWEVFPKFTAFLKSTYHFTLGTYFINKAVDGVRAVSEWEKEEMVKKGIQRSKVTVISNGIENEAFKDIGKLASSEIKKKVKNIGRYIIRIGRIYPIKNDETTIRALPYTDKDIKYVIVGPVHKDKKNRNYLGYLKYLVKELDLEDRVIFFGVIRGIDKYYLIKNALMMVHMAIWESFCNVVHEAMSQGVTVIVANNTALPYLVKEGENGYLVETRNYRKVAKKINYVCRNKDKDELKAMSKLNKKLARNHAWKNVAEKMHKFYMELLRK